MVKYYSKQEVMAYLKISLPTLNRYMKQGLKYHKVGRNVRFKMREINAFRKDKMKHYLTWEEVIREHTYKVLLNGKEYEITKFYDDYEYRMDYISITGLSQTFIYEVDKQFFNDLKLELVEE
jgi:excisionase family DNA binding protein